MIKKGDVVYFKRAKRSTRNDAADYVAKGHHFGFILGHVPAQAAEPPESEIWRLMGTIGFCSLDDIAEFLGEEVMREVIAKFEDKYYGKIMESPRSIQIDSEGTPQPSPLLLLNPDGVIKGEGPRPLLDVQGKPMHSGKSDDDVVH